MYHYVNICLSLDRATPCLQTIHNRRRTMINYNSDNIKVKGHKGTWYVIDCEVVNGRVVYLLEHEQYGDEALNVIVDGNGNLLLEDVSYGIDELIDVESYH